MAPQVVPNREVVSRRSALGFTLVELLIVLAITGVLVGMAITQFDPSLHDQLFGAGQVVLADLAYARSLAVANNSRYRITFDPAAHEYYLEHSGTNAALNNLPDSPYRAPTDPSTRQTTRLQSLAGLGGQLELSAVRQVTSSTQTAATTCEFGPLGALTTSADVQIWLALGQGTARRFLPVTLNSVTGLASVGELGAAGAPRLAATDSSSSFSSSGSTPGGGESTGSTPLFDFGTSTGSGTSSGTSDSAP